MSQDRIIALPVLDLDYDEALNPDHGDRGPFCGRQSILYDIDRSFDNALYYGSEEHPRVNIIRGPGKTWLLEEIQRRSRERSEIEQTTIFLRMDELIDEETGALDRGQVVGTLIEQSDLSLGREYDTARRPERGTSLNSLIGSLNRRSNATGEAIILCVDDIDRLDEEDMKWLEDNVLIPVSRGDNALIFETGSGNIRHHRVEYRRKIYPSSSYIELRPFDMIETRQQVLSILSGDCSGRLDEIAEIIYKNSFGDPLINSRLASLFRRSLSESAGEYPSDDDVLDVVYSCVVEKCKRLFERYGPERLTYLWNFIWLASLSRGLRCGSARTVVTMSGLDQREEISDAFFINVFKDLESVGIMFWYKREHGYTLKPGLRIPLLLLVMKRYPNFAIENLEALVTREKKDKAVTAINVTRLLYYRACLAIARNFQGKPFDSDEFLRLFREDIDSMETYCSGGSRFTDEAHAIPRTIQHDPKLEWILRLLDDSLINEIIAIIEERIGYEFP